MVACNREVSVWNILQLICAGGGRRRHSSVPVFGWSRCSKRLWLVITGYWGLVSGPIRIKNCSFLLFLLLSCYFWGEIWCVLPSLTSARPICRQSLALFFIVYVYSYSSPLHPPSLSPFTRPSNEARGLVDEQRQDAARPMEQAPADARSAHLFADNLKGFLLAVASSAFIGASFIIKKKGLKRAGACGSRAGTSPLRPPLLSSLP